MANNLESALKTSKSLEKSKQKTKKRGDSVPNKPIDTPNYSAIANSAEFKTLKRKKNKFILPITIFFLLSYILLPILTSYTTILNNNAFGDVAWVWVYALSLFVMTWMLCMVYVRRANDFDKEAEQIFEKEKAGDYK